MKIFISHSSRDEAIYSPLCLALDAAGLERWDVKSMALGDSLSDQIRQAIKECDQCVFIATKTSTGSPWCLAELGAFWGAQKNVILYLADPDLEEESLPPQFRGSLTARNADRLITQLRDETTTPSRKVESAVKVRPIMSREELYLECAGLIRTSKIIRDTSWGRRPRELRGQEKEANEAYRKTIPDSTPEGQHYYELFAFAEERIPRIQTAMRITEENPRYEIKVLDTDLSSLSMIDMMIGDTTKVIMSHVDARDPEAGRQFLYIESEEIAAIFIQLYKECWRAGKDPGEFPELLESVPKRKSSRKKVPVKKRR